ncbi:MAG: ABC transporter permease [Erysipelotrichaceae bacterium]|nr:ABC transporter permease [Erysipelotrichaceae bacterium]
MRTFLTMLGIIIGIGSVIAIMTVGNSLSGSLTNSLSSFGITNITVSLTNKDSDSNMFRMFMRESYKESDLMNDDMIDEYKNAYKDYINYVITSESVGSTTVTNGDNEAYISISGITSEYKDYQEIEMITGRFISDEDNDNKQKFCVVSDQFVSDLGYSSYNAVGLPIRITVNGYLQEFTIIGIYHYESETSESFSSSSKTTTNMYVPISTAKYLLRSKDGYSSFTIVSKADIDTTWLLEQTQSFFESFYTQNDSYTVDASNMEAMLETMTEMLSTITIAISCIAAISLLVGGIGVMNIMLVSITERTREIGTRKALGATQNAIRMQFIIEAIIVCLIGGFIGIMVGLGIGAVAANILGYQASPNIMSIVLSVLFSISIGVFFGYYPANKAAKLNPIDALRYE